jgi:hypothetical protein
MPISFNLHRSIYIYIYIGRGPGSSFGITTGYGIRFPDRPARSQSLCRLSYLAHFINKCLRKILRIFWPDKITNNELWKRTMQQRIYLPVRKRKWGRQGHTVRRPSDGIARQALEWDRQGKGAEGDRGTHGEERRLKGPKELKRPGRD